MDQTNNISDPESATVPVPAHKSSYIKNFCRGFCKSLFKKNNLYYVAFGVLLAVESMPIKLTFIVLFTVCDAIYDICHKDHN